MEIKYRNHNPDKECECDICKVVNEVVDYISS